MRCPSQGLYRLEKGERSAIEAGEVPARTCCPCRCSSCRGCWTCGGRRSPSRGIVSTSGRREGSARPEEASEMRSGGPRRGWGSFPWATGTSLARVTWNPSWITARRGQDGSRGTGSAGQTNLRRMLKKCTADGKLTGRERGWGGWGGGESLDAQQLCKGLQRRRDSTETVGR